jgi:hypothetical protein
LVICDYLPLTFDIFDFVSNRLWRIAKVGV